MKRLIIAFIFCILFIDKVIAEEILTPVVAYSKVDKTQATIGDMIEYEISIDYDKRVKPNIPDIKKYLEDFSVVKETIQPEKNIDNRLVQVFNYKIQAKEAGSYIIKPVIINYNIPEDLKSKFISGNLAKTSKIYIDIKSVLKPEEKNKDIDDIKDIENIDVYDYKKIILYLVSFIIGLLIIFLLVKFFRRNKKELLPHEWAFEQIKNLKKDGVNKKLLKPTYFKLSEILRTYISKRFNIQVLPMTLDEIDKSIKNFDDLTLENKQFINSFIEKTDFYKYTDNNGDYDECLSMIDNLNKFVDETKPVIKKEKSNAK